MYYTCSFSSKSTFFYINSHSAATMQFARETQIDIDSRKSIVFRIVQNFDLTECLSITKILVKNPKLYNLKYLSY